MTQLTFRKATKEQEKLRMALDGPAGAGKTYTSLLLGTYLADQEHGRIALIDSERSSAKKYAKEFDFDHLTLPDFDPRTYTAAVRAAVDAGYAVLIVDSLSHAWEGALEMKDRVTRQDSNKDSFGAWRTVTPVHNELVDTILRAPLHVIVTMRTETEYLVDPHNPDRSKRVQKIGLKPVQRKGVDYEFDVVGDMDQENNLVVTKTRCSDLNNAIVHRPDATLAKTLYAWLTDGEPVAARAVVDELVAAMNAIEDVEQRTATKQSFIGRFGLPQQLWASRVDEARAWLAGQLDATPPVVVPDEPAEKREYTPVQLLAIAATKLGVTDRERRLALYTAIVGREVQSGNDLTDAEVTKARDYLHSVDSVDPIFLTASGKGGEPGTGSTEDGGAVRGSTEPSSDVNLELRINLVTKAAAAARIDDVEAFCVDVLNRPLGDVLADENIGFVNTLIHELDEVASRESVGS